MLYSFYTSVLVSHLVNVKYESSINSVDNLIDSQLDIGFLNTTIIRNLLRVSICGLIQSMENSNQIWLQGTVDPRDIRLLKKKVLDTKRSNESFYLISYDGFEKVRQGHFGFLCQESFANRVVRNIFEPYEICETRRINFRNEPVGIILKKYSPLRERFVINLLWLNEVGIHFKINLHWNGRKLKCLSHNHYESVRIEYLAPIFGILILAYISSIGILVVEMWRDLRFVTLSRD